MCRSAILNLKQLAVELNIPVVVTSQISRSTEDRCFNTPTLKDACTAYFGFPQRYADTILFLYRKYYYLMCERPMSEKNESEADFKLRVKEYEEELRENKNLADIIVWKSSKMLSLIVELYFNSEFGRFSDYMAE